MVFARRGLIPAVLLFLTACGQIERLEQKASGSSAQQKAKDRVSGVLLGVQKGGADTTIDVQNAICLWYNGKVLLDFGTLSRASDLFLTWQNEGNIARRISGFSITDASDLEEGVVAVSGTIEGQAFRVKVPPGAPISWIDVPGATASLPPGATASLPNGSTSNSPSLPVTIPTPTPTRTPDPAGLGTLRLRCSYLIPGTVVTLSIDGSEVFRREIHASTKRDMPPIDERFPATPGLHSVAFDISSSDGTPISDRRAPLTISAGQLRTLSVSPQGSGVSIELE